MQWTELEQFVVDVTSQHCQDLCGTDATQFARELQQAYAQLGPNPNYALPLTGEAYAFKYHLQRMDNVGTALRRVHQTHALLRSQTCQILDMAAGTGSSAVAALNWASENLNFANQTLKVRCAEPSASMRRMAEVLLPRLCERLWTANPQFPEPEEACRIYPYSMEECARRCTQATASFVDLVIFSYSFWIQQPAEWPRTTQWVLDIARVIRSSGVLLFLTPRNSPEKQAFMEHLSQQLLDARWQQLEINIPNSYSPGVSSLAPPGHPKRPTSLRRSMLALNEQCNQMTGIYPFGSAFGNLEDDFPYLGFWGTAQAFVAP